MDTVPTSSPLFVCLAMIENKLACVICRDLTGLRNKYHESSNYNFKLLEKVITNSLEEARIVQAQILQFCNRVRQNQNQPGQRSLTLKYEITYNVQHQTYVMSTLHALIPPNSFYTPPVYPSALIEVLLSETHENVIEIPTDAEGRIKTSEGVLLAPVFISYSNEVVSLAEMPKPKEVDPLESSLEPRLQFPLRKSPTTSPKASPTSSPKSTRKPRIRVTDGTKPANYMKRWTLEEYITLADAVRDREITVELIQEIASNHSRTFSAIQGKLLTKEHITRQQSIDLSEKLKGISVTSPTESAAEVLNAEVTA